MSKFLCYCGHNNERLDTSRNQVTAMIAYWKQRLHNLANDASTYEADYSCDDETSMSPEPYSSRLPCSYTSVSSVDSTHKELDGALFNIKYEIEHGRRKAHA